MSWFKQSNFWSRFYEFMFPPDSFENTAIQVDDSKKLFDLETATVLDLCYGPGRHCIPLKKAEFEVTGVGLEPFLLEKAREYAV